MNGPLFEHLLSISDGVGTFEHADHTAPRLEHGYCTDDVARVMVVVVREPAPDDAVAALGAVALQFVADSQRADGRTRNRRTASGRWHGAHVVDDCWGRSLWAFGSVARRAPEESTRRRALSLFERGVQQRSPSRRAMAFAALGAAEVVDMQPSHEGARSVLADAVTRIGLLPHDPAWRWPESRLTYANAVFPEVLIAAGHLLERPDTLADGLTMLRWLLDRETVDGHLSPTPVGGAGPDDRAPAFDQQPIEVAAMADACVRAATVTGDDDWNRGVEMSIDWFDGINDSNAVMWDASTGGGFDGLQASGPNLNQGAESTLALISTRQHVRRHAVA